MFGGDEVGALVMDIGTANTRFGYAGEDRPKCFFPTVVGSMLNPEDKSQSKKIVGSSVQNFRPNMEISRPVQNGLISDWDAVERIWSHSLQYLNLPAHHPFLVVEPSFNTTALREKYVELLFERFETPAVFLCKDAVLSAFSAGRSSAMVIDCGAGKTSVTPVHDGYVLHKGVRYTKAAGNVIDSILEQDLFGPTGLLPNQSQAQFEFKRTFTRGAIPSQDSVSADARIIPAEGGFFTYTPCTLQNVTPSYRQWMVQRLIQDIKSQPFFSVLEGALDPSLNLPSFQYSLPDGQTLDVGTERFSIPELMFSPQNDTQRRMELKDEKEQFAGLHNMVNNSIASCDTDIKKDLLGNMVVTGGHVYARLPHRLQQTVSAPRTGNAMKVKVISQQQHDRMFGPWLGGSILASLGSFHQMWFSRAEFEEHGVQILARKCP